MLQWLQGVIYLMFGPIGCAVASVGPLIVVGIVFLIARHRNWKRAARAALWIMAALLAMHVLWGFALYYIY